MDLGCYVQGCVGSVCSSASGYCTCYLSHPLLGCNQYNKQQFGSLCCLTCFSYPHCSLEEASRGKRESIVLVAWVNWHVIETVTAAYYLACPL